MAKKTQMLGEWAMAMGPSIMYPDAAKERPLWYVMLEDAWKEAIDTHPQAEGSSGGWE